MRRKRIAARSVNQERWVLSYADFVTLLFALFVVMFVSAETSHDKARQISMAVDQALQGKRASHTKSKSTETKKPPDWVNDLLPSFHLLQREFASEIQSSKIKISLENRGLVISMREAAFFPPGDDQINSETLPAFQKLATVLQGLPNPVRMEGHTDSVPIHNGRYRSNWELSTARALAVLNLMEQSFAISRHRLSAAGYADTAPAESNESDLGRSRNRRVDVVVLTGSGVAGQPTVKLAQ